MKSFSFSLTVFFFALTLLVVTTQGQNVSTQEQTISSQEEVLLTVSGEGLKTFQLTKANFSKLPRRSVRVKDHSGKDAVFEGVELYEVLKIAGVPLGQDLSGDRMSLFLLVEASDGYKVVFALPEIDKGFTDRLILVADQRDGKPLSAQEGKLRLVVPDEKRHARWVRQITKLSILRANQ